MPKRNCSFLKNFDRMGVPIKLNFNKKSSYTTRLGGFVSLIGILVIAFFTFGTLYQFFTFGAINQTSTEKYRDFTKNSTCSSELEDESCSHLSPQNLMPFVSFVDNNNSSMKSLNLSQYIIPEFYAQTKHVNGSVTNKWYDVVECRTLYPEKTSKTLENELIQINNVPWLCPNITDNLDYHIVLQNDPKTLPFGSSFNFVVNFCDVVA